MRVEYTKWDGRLHWHFDLELLGEDDQGMWLAARPGCRLQRGSEPPILSDGFACLVPHEGWWIAYFNVAGDVDVYVDVTSEPKRLDHRVEAIDLDLDVVRWRDGRIVLEDEDEFLEHQREFSYPADVIERTTATANELLAAVSAREEPFGESYERWLHLIREAGTSSPTHGAG